MPLNDEELAKVRAHLGVADLSADKAIDVLIASGGAALDAVDAAQVSLARMESELEEAKAQVVSLSRGGSAKPTATEIFWANKALSAAEQTAVAAGAVTPADAAEIRKRLIRKAIDPDTISMSREVEDDDGVALSGMAVCADVFEVLAKGRKGPKAGESSGAQVFSMSREIPGTEGVTPPGERPNPYADTIARLTGEKQ